MCVFTRMSEHVHAFPLMVQRTIALLYFVQERNSEWTKGMIYKSHSSALSKPFQKITGEGTWSFSLSVRFQLARLNMLCGAWFYNECTSCFRLLSMSHTVHFLVASDSTRHTSCTLNAGYLKITSHDNTSK